MEKEGYGELYETPLFDEDPEVTRSRGAGRGRPGGGDKRRPQRFPRAQRAYAVSDSDDDYSDDDPAYPAEEGPDAALQDA